MGRLIVCIAWCAAWLLAAVANAAEPRAVLRDVLARSSGWVHIHAAEALLQDGDHADVLESLQQQVPPGAAPAKGYAVGVMRVKALAAAPDERETIITHIRGIAADANSPDRLHAIETLAKLRASISSDLRAALATAVVEAPEADRPVFHWLLAQNGTPVEKATAKGELVKAMTGHDNIAVLRAAFALRNLGELRSFEWNRIGDRMMKADLDPLAQAYVTSAGFVLAPSADSLPRYRQRAAQLLKSEVPGVRYEVAHGFGERGGSAEVPLLEPLLADDDLDVRVAAASALIKIAARHGEAPAMAPPRASRPLPPAEGVVYQQDVAFLPSGRIETLDLYLPAHRAPGTESPAVVMMHGGAWLGGDKAGGREHSIGVTLAQAGFVYASINYQMDPSARWPQNLIDCKNAVRFLRSKADTLGIDPKNIGVIGSSAGGHLALMVAYTSPRSDLDDPSLYPGVSAGVQCVVNLFGVTELATWRRPPETPPDTPHYCVLFSAQGGGDFDLYALASPITYVRGDVPPTLSIHGTIDKDVDIEQARKLHRALSEAGAQQRLLELDGVGHSFDLTKTWEKQPLANDLRPIVIQFFEDHLRRPS